MPSWLDKQPSGQQSSTSRPLPKRHQTTSENNSPLSTPPLSRANSTSSVTSHKSEPGWMSSFNGIDTTRKSSNASTQSSPHHSTSGGSTGLKGLFSSKPKDQAKKKKDKDLERMAVLTSRHAAAVKSKLTTDPKYRQVQQHGGKAGKSGVQIAGVTGTQNSQHLTAEQQEMRHPHSGPPALHAKYSHPSNDMALLTRIVSEDERDEEDEWERQRNQWIESKRPDVGMRRVVEGEIGDEAATTTTTPLLSPEASPEREREKDGERELRHSVVMQHGGTKMVGAEIEGHEAKSRQSAAVRTKMPAGLGWKRNEKGNWTR